ncbi:hypothetical protein Psi02_31360 [Planotetraspora silvatica]|uniref:Uncharacterized protein n=1 Tax=Planotetraspora silvatica TaxID=234614 RepID=A0A8J3UKM8_9ACTN|nr:hypothetical protein [Planotetraspora silvatica]GII46712.1 hypothetical protein Psi02_31360 [Planotetraspora silvatica]
MRFSKFLALATSGITAAGAVALTVNSTGTAAAGGQAQAGDYYSGKWGVIGRNTKGNPNAVLRLGPWGHSSAGNPSADAPPPYGLGSLGLIVGSSADHIQFGNETDFAGVRLADINVLKYWIFTGVDADVFPTINRPTLNMEVDPNVGAVDYTSLVYVGNTSVSPSAPSTPAPNVWQQYDAGAAGSKWFMTNPGVLTSCRQTNPCSFAELKALLPDAVITYSLSINKGPNDGPFVGAVDGLQVNGSLYDFEPLGVRKFPGF